MTKPELDYRLAHDCYTLGHWQDSQLLLMDNSLVPWVILVPDTMETEFYKIPHPQQLQTLNQINLISEIIEQNFTTDKLNIATIGNIVSQMHIHIIGRNKEDYCWPGVCWGKAERIPYTQSQLDHLASLFENSIKNNYQPLPLLLKDETNM